MKKIKILLPVLFLFLSCTSGKVVMDESVDLSNYNYIVVDTPATATASAVKVYRIFYQNLTAELGKKNWLITEEKLFKTANESAKYKALKLNFSTKAIKMNSESIGDLVQIVINFYDYRTNKLLFSSTSKSGIVGNMEKKLKEVSIYGLKDFPVSGLDPNSSPLFTVPWKRHPIVTSETMEYFKNNISGLNFVEGIWTSMGDSKFKIAVVKPEYGYKGDYVGVVMETNMQYWLKQQVKFILTKTAYPTVFSAEYHTSNHQAANTTGTIDKEGRLVFKYNIGGTDYSAVFIKNYPTQAMQLAESFKILKEFGEAMKKVIPQTSTGSGFLISSTGHVTTNYHVIENAKEIEVLFPEVDKKYTAKVVLNDKSNDLAILQLQDFALTDISNTKIPYGLIKSNNEKIAADIYTLGFPMAGILGNSIKFSDGKINSEFGVNDDPRVFQINAPVQPGNSGGGLFNRDGNIVGIVVSRLNAKYFYENENNIPQNVNFAVKSNYLISLSEMLPKDSKVIGNNSSLKGMALEKQIEAIKPFIVQIVSKIN